MPKTETAIGAVSQRGLECLVGRAKGYSDEDVAKRLGITADAVNKHFSNLRRALNLPVDITLAKPITELVSRGLLPVEGVPERVDVTKAQQRVLEGIQNGLQDKQIAAGLGLSVYTIHKHSAGLLARFEAKTRYQLAAKSKAYEMAQAERASTNVSGIQGLYRSSEADEVTPQIV